MCLPPVARHWRHTLRTALREEMQVEFNPSIKAFCGCGRGARGPAPAAPPWRDRWSLGRTRHHLQTKRLLRDRAAAHCSDCCTAKLDPHATRVRLAAR